MTTKLKPCPFCGGKATIHESLSRGCYFASCFECLARTETKCCAADASKSWNRRVKKPRVTKRKKVASCLT